MNFYTYIHTRNDTGEVFYIGKGKKKRAYSLEKRNEYWSNIVKKYGHTVQILAYWKTEEEAYAHEELLISCFKDLSKSLTNICDNNMPPKLVGENNPMFNKVGELHHLYGKKRPEHSEYMKKLMSGEFNPMTGKKHKESTKMLMSLKRRKEKNPMFGKHMTLTCPHCDKTGGRMMLRWHFNNCRTLNNTKA